MKRTLLTLSVLSVSALNAFAVPQIVNSGTLTESGTAYDNAGTGTPGFALAIFGDTAGYVGTNITLSSIPETEVFVGAEIYNGGFLSLTGGSITGTSYGVLETGIGGIGVYSYNQSNGILNGVTIAMEGTDPVSVIAGAMAEYSTLTLTNSDLTVTNAWIGIGLMASGHSTVSADLNHNTVTGDYSIVGSSTDDETAIVTVTGSNGSVITGDVVSAEHAVVTITLTGADTALHGDLYNYDPTGLIGGGPGTLNLTLSAGALLHGSGTLDNLTLADGAILGYTGDLTVTTSITLSGGITIDFSNITVQDGEDYLILDYTTASGDVNAEHFTATGLGADQPTGGFFVDNGTLIFNTSAVPEPTTWLLLTLGLSALTLLRRRK
jgi:hypothetical protein